MVYIWLVLCDSCRCKFKDFLVVSFMREKFKGAITKLAIHVDPSFLVLDISNQLPL